MDIREELHKFNNVATTFGQSHRTDEQDRALYLHELDIDSERAYDKGLYCPFSTHFKVTSETHISSTN